MNRKKRILKVPKESFLRNKLRKETRHLVESAGLRPPAPFDAMEQLAIDLLKKLEISEEYIDFVVVLIGNETWRKTVEATPFNRRLLLLPQCLKNTTSCQAEFDELGLICAGCKSCPIDDILVEAEKLGYSTLVAEGTTVAIGLVEEGAIDAVIGVSCMPVLQRSFDAVKNAAVPVIGLPLMYDGCENTKIDTKWLYDEIRAYSENIEMQPISSSNLKLELNNFFANGTLDKYFGTPGQTEKLGREYLQVGGQRMRPLIAALSYNAYAKEVKPEIQHSLSLIIECFHKASLIHDDIEDAADYRYETETAHKKYGIPQAINAGDYLIGKGYQLLSELPVDGKMIARALLSVSQSHLQLTRGQGSDILFHTGKNIPNVDETLQMFQLKTGEAIKVALVLGAVLGEAPDSEIKILEQFADYFGISYQIRDDLNEFREERNEEKIKDYPFLIALLNEQYSGKLSDMGIFREKILERQLDIKAQTILDEYVGHCYSELDKLDNSRLRLSLYGVLGKIFKPLAADAN
ncbi:MAG TPA: polyprenyl synthetase family protein [Draconibacterium sp.]|nr:polyprenyl synthetase family protein [Draconibacterium sp.]